MKLVLIISFLFGSASVFAQFSNQIKEVNWNISQDKVMNSNKTIFRKTMHFAEFSTLRFHFGKTTLGRENGLLIYSQNLKKPFYINDYILSGFSNTTPYFYTKDISIVLIIKNKNSFKGIKIKYFEAMRRIMSTYSICQSDDRIPSSEPRMSRLMRNATGGGGCSGGMISKSCLLTAGHCVTSTTDIAEFNVPDSDPSKTPIPSKPEEQYARQEIIDYDNSGMGNDWAVIRYKANPITNKLPGEVQGYYQLNFNSIQVGDEIRITGYGTDQGTANQTQQTNTGDLREFSQILRYYVDSKPGNSGSPVVHEATDRIIGVHTNGGCRSSGSGSNAGTSFLNMRFVKAIKACLAKEKSGLITQ